MIDAEHIERAEKKLRNVARLGGNQPMGPIADLARIHPAAANAFVAFCIQERLQKLYPELDPRMEPALNTIIFHALCVGAMCGRADRRGE